MTGELKIWYVLVDEQKYGPFSAKELLSENPPIPASFTKVSLVRNSQMIVWELAGNIDEFRGGFVCVSEGASANKADVPAEFAVRKSSSHWLMGESEVFAVEESSVTYSSVNSALPAAAAPAPEKLSLQQLAQLEEAASSNNNVNNIINNISRSVKIPRFGDIVKETRRSLRILNREEPMAVKAAIIGAVVIVICFAGAYVHNKNENKRAQKLLEEQIAQIDIMYTEKLRQKEQARRDSIEAVMLAEQKRAERDSIARSRARNKSSVSGTAFKDPRSGKTYKIRKFGRTTWFLQDLDNGKAFSWNQASTACPKGWRLPSDREWKALSASLKNGAGSYFASNRYWWSDKEGTDSWYVSGGSLVCYSGSDNKSAVYRVRCVK